MCSFWGLRDSDSENQRKIAIVYKFEKILVRARAYEINGKETKGE